MPPVPARFLQGRHRVAPLCLLDLFRNGGPQPLDGPLGPIGAVGRIQPDEIAILVGG